MGKGKTVQLKTICTGVEAEVLESERPGVPVMARLHSNNVTVGKAFNLPSFNLLKVMTSEFPGVLRIQ